MARQRDGNIGMGDCAAIWPRPAGDGRQRRIVDGIVVAGVGVGDRRWSDAMVTGFGDRRRGAEWPAGREGDEKMRQGISDRWCCEGQFNYLPLLRLAVIQIPLLGSHLIIYY